MAVKVKSQSDSSKPSKKSSVVTHVNFRKKANPYKIIMTDELKYTPVPARLLLQRDEETPVIFSSQLKSAKAVKETISISTVASTNRSKGDIFDNDPPFEQPYRSANDGDLCQDSNPRLKAWLASFCPIPANVCWLDKPVEHYRKKTESSQKVRLKVAHQSPPNKRYCYLPLNPVLGWRGLRPPTVNDLIQRAYKDGKSFLSPAQRRNIYGEQMLSNSVSTTPSNLGVQLSQKSREEIPRIPHTPFSQGAKLDQSDRECAEAHVDAWLDHIPTIFDGDPSIENWYEGDLEVAQDKQLKAYRSCDEHKRLCMALYSHRNNPGAPTKLSFFDHMWCEQEREFERYKEVLFEMQYTTPHIDYLPDAVDLELEGQLVKAGSRYLGWYIGAVAPIERFFKRTDREIDHIWKSFCRQAERYWTGEISLEILQKIGRYNYSRHRLGLEAKARNLKSSVQERKIKPIIPDLKQVYKPYYKLVNDSSEFLSTVVASKYRKKMKEQRICEERAYRDVLRSGHESRPAAPLSHLILLKGWRKLGSLLVPPGYDETTGRIVVPPSNIESYDSDKLSRLKTG